MSTQAERERLRQMRATAAIIIACTLLAVAIVGLRYSPVSHQPHVSSVDHDTTPPDGIATGAQLTQFDETGHMVRRVDGEEIRFFEPTNETLVHNPVITLPDQNDPNAPWRITAKEALMKKQVNQVDFSGDVKIQADTQKHGKITIETQQLSVDLDKQFAETDKAVTIYTATSRAEAIGLQADFSKERLLLTSNVKETHEPRR